MSEAAITFDSVELTEVQLENIAEIRESFRILDEIHPPAGSPREIPIARAHEYRNRRDVRDKGGFPCRIKPPRHTFPMTISMPR
jgi:hypothetical protein